MVRFAVHLGNYATLPMNLLPLDNTVRGKQRVTSRLRWLYSERVTRPHASARYLCDPHSYDPRGEHFGEEGINDDEAIVRLRSRVRCADVGGACC